ncbi:MAG: YafY family transcriptional regulator [Polyangiaceae bacterium]|nr:YafY family transcriptional regulator [Polyangiaceae bacterium]
MLDTSARLLKLLSVLQTKRHWGGFDLADHLDVTPRTLRRDVDRLRTLGYAVDASSGPGGGYQLGKGSTLPPLLLDDAEAVAVAVSLRSAADAFMGLSETAMSALLKLEQLLPGRLRRRVSAIQAVTVSISTGTPTLDADVLTSVAAACRDSETLRFSYKAKDGTATERVVEPLRLAHTGYRRWYLLAWDTAREDWRTFRVDRIDGKVYPGARFIPKKPPKDVAEYIKETISNYPQRYKMKAKLSGSAAMHTKTVPRWCGSIEPIDDESCYFVSSADSIEMLASQLVSSGVDFEFVEPKEILPELRKIAKRFTAGTRGAA